jgi:RNA polymerase sigma-70 factor (ECF subfamily)
MPDAFEQFVEDHYRSAYLFAYSLCGKHEDACDLTQQAFFIAQTKGAQVRDESKRKQWLFTIVRREFLHGRRSASAHPQSNLELVERELPLISVDHAATMDSKSVLAVLLGLDESFRAPLTLFYLEQLSYRDIAEVLEMPIGTVMSRLARGKSLMRERLETYRAGNAGRIVPLPSQAEGGTRG